MTYYTKQILGSDGNEYTYVFCNLENGAVKSFIADPANTDYQEFLRWKEQGNEPLPPDA